MAYPSPTIYVYRIKQIYPGSGACPGGTPIQNGYFETQFSVDGGTNYRVLHANPFFSQTEAANAIAAVVGSESQFRTAVQNGQGLNTPFAPANQSFLAYPP